MSDVHLDEEGTELERELLASWKTMTAPEDARKKALGVLAAGATAVVATQAAVAASAGGKAAAAKSAGVLAKVFGKIVAKVSAGLNLGAGASVAAPVATGIVAKTVIATAVVATTVVGVEVGAPIVREKLEHRAVSGVVVAPQPADVAGAVAPKSDVVPEHEAPPLADDLVVEDDLALEEVVVPEPVVPPSNEPAAEEERPTASSAPKAVVDAPKAVAEARKSDDRKETTKRTQGALVAAAAPQATDAVPTGDETPKKKAPKTPAASSDLTDALRAIQSGREALANRNPTAAIEYLTVIGNDSPLAAEAMALRFDAYTRAGNKEAARYVAKKLVTSFPDSPYASRMQRALEEGE